MLHALMELRKGKEKGERRKEEELKLKWYRPTGRDTGRGRSESAKKERGRRREAAGGGESESESPREPENPMLVSAR